MRTRPDSTAAKSAPTGPRATRRIYVPHTPLYRIVRMRYHQPTKDYVDRRTSEGKSKPEIIRCLKRYVAREVYTALKQTGEANLARAV
jgi:hypothetical protein